MTARGAQRLLALVSALAILSVLPAVAAGRSLPDDPVPSAWAAAVLLAYAAVAAALLHQALRPGRGRLAFWLPVVVGNLAVASFGLVAELPLPRTPWVLAFSPLTVGVGGVVARLPGAMALATLHVGVRVVLEARGVWSRTPEETVLDVLGLYVITVAASVAVQAVRGSVEQVARARAAAERATVDAAAAAGREREEARWDAIVHDDVLASLTLTAQARTPRGTQDAVASARAALLALDRDVPPAPWEVADLLVRLRAEVGDAHPGAVLDVPVDLSGPGGPRAACRVDPDAADALVDAAVEAVRNAVRHGTGPDGRPPVVGVRVRVRAGRLLVQVRDDGAGFDTAHRPPHRLGLAVSVRRRADVVGGTAIVRSAPGVGTVVLLGVPLLAAAGAGAEVP